MLACSRESFAGDAAVRSQRKARGFALCARSSALCLRLEGSVHGEAVGVDQHSLAEWLVESAGDCPDLDGKQWRYHPGSVDGLKDRPEAKNLVNIYAALSGQSADAVLAEFEGAQFGTFKPRLADLAVAKLSPITTEMNRLMTDPAEIDRILGDGADRADEIAGPILEQVFDITGMVRSRRR